MMASLDQQTSGVELTPKGIGYAKGYGKHARVHLFHSGVDPALDFRDWRASIEAEIERLIGLLDEFDGDADLEPSLGAPEACLHSPIVTHVVPVHSQVEWARGWGDDDEQVNEDGGDVLDEPHDANTSEDCEPDPEPRYPNGSWLPGGSGAA